MAQEIIIHSFDRVETSDKYKEVKHFTRFCIRGNEANTRIKECANISLQRHFNKSQNVCYWYKGASMNNGKRGKWSSPITGLYPTNNSLIYYGDISEKQPNGYMRKVSFLFFVFKCDNSRMAIFEYPNYYPPASEVGAFISSQIGYVKKRLGL